MAASNVEGGMYISPEFQLGQVYMGDEVDPETDQTILYRPVYVCVSGESQAPCKTDVHLLQVTKHKTTFTLPLDFFFHCLITTRFFQK